MRKTTKTDPRQLQYAEKYAAKLRRVMVNLHLEQDADLIEHLDALRSGDKNSTIKQALRDFFAKS